MELSKFQELSKRTMPVPKTGTLEEFLLLVCNYAMGLGGESGEVQDELKKWVHHKHQLDEKKIMKELGDVLHYLCGVATLIHIDMDEVAQMNLDKLSERYPNGFTPEDSIKRKDVKNENRN